MNANNHFAFRNQTFLFFQLRCGNIDINGRNSRWLHRDKRLLIVVQRPSRQAHWNQSWVFLISSVLVLILVMTLVSLSKALNLNNCFVKS